MYCATREVVEQEKFSLNLVYQRTICFVLSDSSAKIHISEQREVFFREPLWNSLIVEHSLSESECSISKSRATMNASPLEPPLFCKGGTFFRAIWTSHIAREVLLQPQTPPLSGGCTHTATSRTIRVLRPAFAAQVIPVPRATFPRVNEGKWPYEFIHLNHYSLLPHLCNPFACGESVSWWGEKNSQRIQIRQYNRQIKFSIKGSRFIIYSQSFYLIFNVHSHSLLDYKSQLIARTFLRTKRVHDFIPSRSS